MNAGNVLVVEDNEPAGKWMELIYQALNRPPAPDGQSSGDELSPPESTSSHYPQQPSQVRQGIRDPSNTAIPKSSSGGQLFAQKPPPPLKMVNKSYRVDNALVKTCTCMSDPSTMQRRAREMREFLYRVEAAAASPGRSAGADDDALASIEGGGQKGGGINYCLIARKQMVGIFLSVWPCGCGGSSCSTSATSGSTASAGASWAASGTRSASARARLVSCMPNLTNEGASDSEF